MSLVGLRNSSEVTVTDCVGGGAEGEGDNVIDMGKD